MMKFIVKQASKGCRMGVISELPNHPGLELETPMCLLYTRAASAPYLSIDILNRIENLPEVAQIPVAWSAENIEALEEYGKGVAEFAALKGFVVYSSIQDVAEAFHSGYNDKNGAATWGKGGKVKVNVDLYSKLLAATQTDWTQCLCDSDTDQKSSRKRNQKAVDRTLTFLDQYLEKQQNSKVLQKVAVFGVIEGGYLLEERLRSTQETIKRPVAGYSIEGFYRGGAESTRDFKLSETEDIINKVMALLPEDKPRLMHAVWEPHDVIHAIKLGVDILDSSFPYIVTERGGALIFNFQRDIPVEEIVNKAGAGDSDKNTQNQKPYEIYLKDKRYFDDLTPILPQCTCYTCKNHTKSYVCHLLNTSEILAGVLLMIHNFHHYFSFFSAIRTALKDDRLDQLEELIQR